MATLEENIAQAISDFDDIKSAICEGGYAYIPNGTDTKEYGGLIRQAIQTAENTYYAYGHSDGWGAGYPAGEENERETFWNNLQNNGRRNGYRFAFYDWYWNDTNFNPQHTIICSGVSTDMMRYASITDTKVDINFSHANSGTVFANNAYLKTIRKLIVTESVAFTSWFAQCTALTNVTFEGTIGKDINFQHSPLSVGSMKSVISCLKNYAGTSNANKYTVTFTDECWVALEASGTAPNGGTWKAYVMDLGWLT